MEPNAGGAGATIEGERHGTSGRPGRVGDVRHQENLGFRLKTPEYAVLLDLFAQHHAAGRR